MDRDELTLARYDEMLEEGVPVEEVVAMLQDELIACIIDCASIERLIAIAYDEVRRRALVEMLEAAQELLQDYTAQVAGAPDPSRLN
jgi:hypothetical protein